jgi:hypothetical protein
MHQQQKNMFGELHPIKFNTVDSTTVVDYNSHELLAKYLVDQNYDNGYDDYVDESAEKHLPHIHDLFTKERELGELLSIQR